MNILGHRHSELAVRFARAGDRFAGVRTLPMDDDIPVLAEALTVLICDVRDELAAGDHTVVLGQVRAIRVLRHGRGLDTLSLRGAAPSRGEARLLPRG